MWAATILFLVFTSEVFCSLPNYNHININNNKDKSRNNKDKIIAPPSPQAVQLQQALNQSIAKHSPIFVLPGGNIYFNDMAFLVLDASNMIIDGNGTTLWFSPGVGVWVKSCTGIFLRNFTIDYSPPPFVYGIVTSVSANPDSTKDGLQLTVKLSPNSITYEDFIANYSPHDTWPPTVIFSQDSEIRCTPCGWGSPVKFTKISDGMYTVEDVCGNGASVGDPIVSPTRIGFTYLVTDSNSVTTTYMNIHHASNFAILEGNGICGNSYRNIRIASPYSDRPLGSNADAFHSLGCKNGPILQNSYIRNTDDDFMNIHNTVQFVGDRFSDNSLLIIDAHLFDGEPNSIYGTFETFSHVTENDEVAFYSLNQLAASDRISTAVVASVEKLDSSQYSKIVQQTYQAGNSAARECPLNACSSGLKPWAGYQVYNVTFKSGIPSKVVPTVIVDVVSWSNGKAIVQENDFSGTSASLGRIKSSGSKIMNNNLGHSCLDNFEVGPLQCWMEGMMGITGVTVELNVISDSGNSPFHVYASDALIVNNTIKP